MGCLPNRGTESGSLCKVCKGSGDLEGQFWMPRHGGFGILRGSDWQGAADAARQCRHERPARPRPSGIRRHGDRDGHLSPASRVGNVDGDLTQERHLEPRRLAPAAAARRRYGSCLPSLGREEIAHVLDDDRGSGTFVLSEHARGLARVDEGDFLRGRDDDRRPRARPFARWSTGCRPCPAAGRERGNPVRPRPRAAGTAGCTW